MITVFGRASSANVQPVTWTLAELGLSFDRRDYGVGFAPANSPEILAMNPNGRVPVLRDDEVTLWESAAILRYLAARHATAPFWPASPVARAPVDMWAEWGKSTLRADFVGPVFRPMVFVPAAKRDPAVLAAALATVERDLDILAARLADHPYAAGPDFTLADVVIGSILHRYFTLPIPRPDRPALAAYYDRLVARPAYREHVMVSWQALRVPGA